jgi:type II secretory pathway pseudopilin PulG
MGKMARMVQRKIEFMPNVRRGFSFVQIVVSLAIIAVVSMVVAPNLLRRVPLYERQEFVATLNTVARQAWIQALESGKAHKVVFNIAQRTIRMERKTPKVDHDGIPVFENVVIDHLPAKYEWPEQFEIKQFFIEGVDELEKHAGDKTMEDVWFFVIAEGMAQEVIINLIDTKDTHHALEGQEICLALNPFRVQFEMYEEFQNPASL